MASEPLFDLHEFDLGRTAIPASEIQQLNPQAGEFRQLDRVIMYDLDRGIALGEKVVRDDEFWVPLHVPGRPLYPGVLMVEAAAQLSSVYYRYRTENNGGKFLGFTRIDDTVFRGQVPPGRTMHLLMKEIQVSPRRFICESQGIVDEKLVFETKITGMVM